MIPRRLVARIATRTTYDLEPVRAEERDDPRGRSGRAAPAAPARSRRWAGVRRPGLGAAPGQGAARRYARMRHRPEPSTYRAEGQDVGHGGVRPRPARPGDRGLAPRSGATPPCGGWPGRGWGSPTRVPSPVPLADEPWIRALVTPPGPRRSTRTQMGRASTGGSGRWRSSTPIPRRRRSRPSWSRAFYAGGRLAGGAGTARRARSRCAAGRGSAGRRRASRRGRRPARARGRPAGGAAIERLLAWQWPDGGWNCDKRPEASHSSFNESWGAMRALAVFAAMHADAPLGRDARAGADRAAEFFLAHRVDRSHTTGELAHPNLDGMRWPPYWHYDRLVGLRMLHRRGAPRRSADRRRPRGPAGRSATRRHVARGQALLEAAAARAPRPISRRWTGRSTASAGCSPSRPWRSSPPAEA